MPAEIWNEGRVVGYSAYELYIKQLLSEYPTETPPSERQWLSSTIAMGSSMIVKLPNVTQSETSHTYIDIFFPADSKLVAANNIMASFFDGDAEFDGSWATRVTDYGTLISNNTSSSPSGTVPKEGTVPTQTITEPTSDTLLALSDYMKIVDGIIIQPGTWAAGTTPPAKDLKPNLHEVPRLRLHIKGSISNSPKVLLTGLTIRSTIIGSALLDGSTDTPQPENGDFLGPGAFPWAAKVIFSVPTSYVDFMMKAPSLSVADMTYTAPSGSGAGSNKAKVATHSVTTSNTTESTLTLSVASSTSTSNPSQVTVSQKPSSAITLNASNSDDNLAWSALLAALANDQSIDILGERLKSAKGTLVQAESSSANGCPYLEFGPANAKKRLYISSTVPTGNDIPLGSIGIGWGLASS